VTLFLAVLGYASIYFVDPWLYYRIDQENQNWLDGAYVAPGLIKNQEYDTAVIGSSYFQDFRMDWFRNKLSLNPVNLTVPGLDLYETACLSNAVVRQGKANTQIICLTYYNFEAGIVDRGRIPEYLLDHSKSNDIQYHFSYEAWLKFMPLDLATRVIDRIFPQKLEKYRSMMNPDALGNEMNRFEFNENILMNGYTKQQVFSDVEAEAKLFKMKDTFMAYQNLMQYDGQTQYIYVLPPHSSLYWHYLKEQNLLKTYEDFEYYVIEALSHYDNVRVVNAQTIDEITDLNHYRDTTHYDLAVQEKIVDLIRDGNDDLTLDTLVIKQQSLRLKIAEFEEKYLTNK